MSFDFLIVPPYMYTTLNVYIFKNHYKLISKTQRKIMFRIGSIYAI